MRSVFDCLGDIPLPPYMRRTAAEVDNEHYQTVYANEAGSVAAPTAGLHFTDALLDSLKRRGVKSTRVTLHVGAGTFRPITVTNAADHTMHEEQFSVTVKSVQELVRSLKLGRPLVPVGTTSVRVLESLYWLGVLSLEKKKEEDATVAAVGALAVGVVDRHLLDHEVPHLSQWAPYETRLRLGDASLPSNIDALSVRCIVSHLSIYLSRCIYI